MKKILRKAFAVLALGGALLCAQPASADEYTITFNQTGTNTTGTSLSPETAFDDIFTQNSVITSINSCSKAFYNTNTGLKLNGNNANVTFGLNDKYTITKVTVTRKGYARSTLSVNGTGLTTTSAEATVDYDFSASPLTTNELVLNWTCTGTRACYIKEIKITTGSGTVTPVPALTATYPGYREDDTHNYLELSRTFKDGKEQVTKTINVKGENLTNAIDVTYTGGITGAASISSADAMADGGYNLDFTVTPYKNVEGSMEWKGTVTLSSDELKESKVFTLYADLESAVSLKAAGVEEDFSDLKNNGAAIVSGSTITRNIALTGEGLTSDITVTYSDGVTGTVETISAADANNGYTLPISVTPTVAENGERWNGSVTFTTADVAQPVVVGLVAQEVTIPSAQYDLAAASVQGVPTEPVMSGDTFAVRYNVTNNGANKATNYKVITKVVLPDGTEEQIDAITGADIEVGAANVAATTRNITMRKTYGEEVEFKAYIDWALDEYTDDNVFTFKVKHIIKYDLAAQRVENLPAANEVEPGKVFPVHFVVKNTGNATVNEYQVVVNDGKNDFVGRVAELAVGKEGTAIVRITMDPEATGAVTYTAKVVCDGDENSANDEFASFEVVPFIAAAGKPQVTGLAANVENQNVTLTWNAIGGGATGGSAAVDVTETFEKGFTHGDTAIEGWTFIDNDKAAPFDGVTSDWNLNSVPAKTVFTVLEAAKAYYVGGGNGPSSFYLGISSCADPYPDNDDWAISPKLSGEAQTISFYARTGDSSYDESVNVYYTKAADGEELTTSKFTKVAGKTVSGTSWKNYTFDVPEGATHFAIQYVACNYSMYLDDISYKAAGSGEPVAAPDGYNVYRDGEKINETPVAEATYVDENLTPGVYTYFVRAVYGDEEAASSDNVTATVMGLVPVREVRAEEVEDGVLISWKAPRHSAQRSIARAESAEVLNTNVKGYHVYDTGVKLTTAGMVAHDPEQFTDTYSYLDKDRVAGKRLYTVTAVYGTDGEDQESDHSESVLVIPTGIEGVNGALLIGTAPNTIFVENAGEANVAVVGTDGRLIYNGRGDAQVNVAGGIYMVKVGNKVVKVVVK